MIRRVNRSMMTRTQWLFTMSGYLNCCSATVPEIGQRLCRLRRRNGGKNFAVIVSRMQIGVAVLTAAIGWLQARYRYLAAPAKPADDSSPWFERWPGAVMRWAAQMGVGTLPRLRAPWLAKVGRLRQVRAWQRALDGSERSLQRWAYAITLFLLLAIVVVFVGISSWF